VTISPRKTAPPPHTLSHKSAYQTARKKHQVAHNQISIVINI